MRLSTKKVIISILLGLAGFWCSRYSLSFNNPPFLITITWSYFLPLLAGMAYGPIYGLIAGTVGLDAFFPFLLYPNNGWACLVNSIPFVIWFPWYGYSEQLRRLKPTFWNHPFFVHLPFAVFFVLFMRLFFPVAFSLNPPFWNPQAELSMPIPILESVITKGIIVMYLAVIFDICLLKIPHVRKLFDLEIKKESRNNAWFVLGSLLSSALLWYVSIIFNRIFIDKTFPQGLFQSSDPRENLALLVFLFAGLLMGTIICQYVESRLKAEDELEKSRESYRLIFEQAADGIFITDASGHYVDVNNAGCNLTGYTRDEILQFSTRDLVMPEEEMNVPVRINSINAGINPVFERIMRHKNGSPIQVEISGRKLADGRLQGLVHDISERKQSEKALQEGEKRFRLALRNSPLPIMLHAEDGEVILISQTWTDLTGYTLEDIPTTTLWTQKAYGERQQMVKSKIDNLYDLEQRTNEGEFVIQTKDGKKLTWDFSASMLGGLSDGRRLVISMAVDVTARKDAEQKLIETSAILQAALDNSQAGIAIADAPDGKLRYVNQAGLLIPDKPENELVDGVDADHYVSSWQILHFDGTPFLADEVPLTRAIRYGEKNSKEFIIRRANAEDRYVWANAAPILDEAGSVIAGIVIFLDTTASRSAEEALKKSEQQFRTLFEQAAVGVAITDAQNGQFLRINQRYCDILGYSAEEMLNKTYLAVTHPDEVQISNEKKDLLLAGAIREFSIEKRYIRKDGSLVWVEITVSTMWEPGEPPNNYVTIIQDISSRKEGEEKLNMTYAEMQRLLAEADKSRKVLLNVVEDQKRAEGKLSRLNAELETRVRERTLELEAANKELEAFSYSVSHDLRAPLRTLDGFSALLLSDYAGQLDEQGQTFLHRIKEASQRMGQLINDLLNLSRVARTEFTNQQVDLSALAREIAAELQAQNPNRCPVDWDISNDLVVEGDPNLLKIVLENLLNNAYKFTNQCDQAQIAFSRTVQSGKQVYFIRDNGTGFDMTYANKLFVPFQRLHSVKEYPGTGIGLSIVQRVIARHGGHIWPESEIGKGTTFYFTLGKNA